MPPLLSFKVDLLMLEISEIGDGLHIDGTDLVM